MNHSTIFVEEYLSTLKEDQELDYLFPMLLQQMGFRIIQTAKESKGQNQYGKDVIAIGKDHQGVKHRWYFELKGYTDRNITDKNYASVDGIRESIIEAKDTVFHDSSIPEFNDLPIKIVLVHNGIIKPNVRPTFEGFIRELFKDNKNTFERWDIYRLTELFSKYLFNEYLLMDVESNRLFKKTLAFMDIPNYDLKDFKALIGLQLEKVTSFKGRAFEKLFATLTLLETLLFHYSKENRNLNVAKEGSKFLVLQTWHWILKHKHEKKKSVISRYNQLLSIQKNILNAYFDKTLPIARIANGLYAENGAFFERIGYPLRCFDYLDDMIYYCRLQQHAPNSRGISKYNNDLHQKQKDLIIEVVEQNPGFHCPIIDNHSIPIMQLFLFFANKETLREKDMQFLGKYFIELVFSIIREKRIYDRFPELHNNLDAVVEAVATNKKPKVYCDSSSILIAFLLEISAVLNYQSLFDILFQYIPRELSLQIPSITFENNDVELLFFEKNLHKEYYIESIERKPDETTFWVDDPDFQKFKEFTISKQDVLPRYRTDDQGMSFLRYLAHSYYKNEILPQEWRKNSFEGIQ
ncbi:hypothetical protein [Galbibacter sp.]|uniref:hypothetical protein n=1 Tax=Galbibacter sp. TaxID=2918471 RepID=UPI003A94DD26